MRPTRTRFIFRVRFLFLVTTLFALLLVGRLYVLQVIHGNEFQARAEHQYVVPNQNLYDRGSIFFKDKDGRLVSAATVRSGFLVAISPDNVKDPEDTYQKLSGYLPLEEEKFLSKAHKKGDPYEEIAHKVENTEGNAIESLALPGVALYRERWRYYPGDSLAAQTVGFVAFHGNDLRGQYGLERYWEDTLSRDENSTYVNFFAEVFSDVRSGIFDRGTERKGDIITSIDPSVQLFLENTLSEVIEDWKSKSVGGIVLDPRTGNIYALAVKPSFNLNNFSDADNVSVYNNPLVESVFEMGSIVKPLTLAAGLDAGVITATTTYVDRGTVTFDTETISNYDGKARGRVNMQEVLKQSLNTGAAFVSQRIGNKRFADYLRSFGIGEETGIDLPGEVPGLIENLNSPRDIEYATASFGQGIAMSPIATARAFTALANKGKLVTPHIAQEIKLTSGLSKKIKPIETKEVISPAAAEEITRMLVEVVDTALLGGRVKQENYSIAAKTGTAQIANPEGGGYYEDRFLHSFFGYFPAYDPQFLIFLYNLEPKGARFASQTLTPPFIDITQFLINYYEIPPDR